MHRGKGNCISNGINNRPHLNHKRGGFTVLELMLVVALLMILGAVAIPRMQQSFQLLMLRRLHSILLIQVSEVREQAIAQQRTSHIHFESNQWCAWFEGDSKSDCGLAKGELRRGFSFRASAATPRIFTFSAGRGFSTLSSGTLRLRSDRNPQELWVVVSAVGRVRTCAFPVMDGVPPCV